MNTPTPQVQNDDEVICPNCVHQFRAIPVNVQRDLAAREAELAAMKEKVESLERAYASVMQAVDECGSYRP